MTARAEIRSAASAAGWAQAKGIDPWTDVFTRDAEHTELQAKMLTAANVSWQAQDRIVVHYTESVSMSEASLQTPRQQAALTGFHNGAAAETKGPNRNGHVLADHGGDGLDEWTDPQFPAAGRLRGVRLRRVRGRVLQAV